MPSVRLEPVAPLLLSRVKHSTIKSLRFLTNFVLWVKLQWGFISLYIGLLNSQSLTCADPERFVRGGPNLTFSFKYILVDEGRGDPNTTISGPSSADDGATVNAGFDCSFVIFQGIQTRIAKKPYILCVFFRGGVVRTPCHPSGSANV